MKKAGLLTLLLSLYILTLASDTLKLDSKVEKVVVFLKGAQISRTAKCYLQKGENLINFTKISSHVDKKSIQIKSGLGVTIQSVNFNINYLDSLARVKKTILLRKKNDSLRNEKLILENTLYVLKHEQELLKENQVLGGEKRIITTEELKKASIYYRNRLSEIISLKIRTKAQIRKIEIKKQAIKKQLVELNSKKEKPVGEVWVLVNTDKEAETDFSVEYFISGAGWKPKYDIRTESVSKPAILTYKADIFQNTDDDWTNVELILSSANPSLGGTKPELKRWTLNLNESFEYTTDFQDNTNYQNSVKYYKGLKNNYSDPIIVNDEMIITGTVVYSDDGSGLPGVNIRVKGETEYGTITDLDGNYSLKVPKGAGKLIISFIGMKTEELPITNNIVNCSLSAESLALEEVVVTALGVTRKEKALGYSVTTLVPDGMGGFVQKGLAGRVAGVQIRGASSFGFSSSKIHKEKKKPVSKTLVGLNSVKESQTSIQFVLDKPYTIPSDNKKYAVDIEKYEIPVQYQYETVPKLDESAYLMARLKGWESLNLLSGELNIYFEGAFVGNSLLDVKNTNDTLDISFGRDRAIMIDRKLKKDFSKKQILSKWKVESYTWEIIVKNNKQEKINVLVEDQVPVSYSKSMVVSLLESAGAEFNDKKGELKWNLELKPLEKKVLTFAYQIKTKKRK
ncbi:MAG: mucoidy inhibitor MuiA family protein [Bacteroidota bacterium]